MDAEIKARWLEALRSGRYKQGQTKLRWKEDSFCCLGVLCDIIDSTKWELSTAAAKCYDFTDGHYGMPPRAVFDKIGLSPGFASDLACKNDSGSSFAIIADLIESEMDC